MRERRATYFLFADIQVWGCGGHGGRGWSTLRARGQWGRGARLSPGSVYKLGLEVVLQMHVAEQVLHHVNLGLQSAQLSEDLKNMLQSGMDKTKYLNVDDKFFVS